MNKADVVAKVSEMSGVDPETCQKVIKSLEKVLQSEIGGKGIDGALEKIAGIINFLSPKKEG